MNDIASNCRGEWDRRIARFEEISGKSKQSKRDDLVKQMVTTRCMMT